MTIIAWLSRFFGRADLGDGFVVPEPIPTPRPPRIYKVPDGLKARIVELQDKAEVAGSRFQAHQALWSLIGKRCPETMEGNWEITGTNAEVFVREVLA